MFDIKVAKVKFRQHKHRAEQKNIPFNLTFDEWFKIWTDSGFYALRGRGRGKYVMSRKNDEGGYESGNVFIQLNGDNVSQAHKGKKKNPFEVIIANLKKIGAKRSEETRNKMRIARNAFLSKNR